MSENTTAYTLTLLFPDSINSSKVTQVDYQVTSDPATVPPLEKNHMPETFHLNDTLTFTYKKANKGVKINSCILTQYNIDTSEREGIEDFKNEFDKPITITDEFKGSWIFHLLGMYKSKDKHAAYYLDPEFTYR